MSLSFLNPIEVFFTLNNYKPQQLGSILYQHLPTLGLPDLSDVKIAFFCVETPEYSYDRFREHLYSLFVGNWHFAIADLGNLPQGKTEEDTLFAIQEIAAELIKEGVIPIVIGGAPNATYSLYRAFDNLEQMVNLVSVDPKFNFGNDEELFDENSYMSRLISEPPVNLLNFSNIGYQSYYIAQEELDLFDKMCFEVHRLGNIVNDLKIIEPAMRDADIVSINMSAVQAKDMETTGNINGFNSREICAVARYAGISSNVQVAGIFNVPATDSAAQLIAQMVWYFCEGFNFRIKELPIISDDNYTKYIVLIEDVTVEFFKSTLTQRWWMKPATDKYSGPQNHVPSGLIPCLPQDYEDAVQGTIPERWWRSYRKFI